MKIILPAFILLLFASCKPAVTPEKLYGKWKYIKVDNPNANPPDSVKHVELEAQQPYIQFSKNNALIISWGDKILSHGTFIIDGNNIKYTEVIPGGKRVFPFYVSELTDKEITFETMGEDGSKVVAVKE